MASESGVNRKVGDDGRDNDEYDGWEADEGWETEAEEMRVKRGAERKRTAKVMYPLTTEGKKQDRKGTANAGCLRGNGEEKWTRTP